MRTFVFNLALFLACLLAMVLLLRPLVAAYSLAVAPVSPDVQPQFTPSQPAIEYDNDFYADYQLMPVELVEQPELN